MAKGATEVILEDATRNTPTLVGRAWTMERLMAVKRIVPNIASDQLEKAKSFYAEILDMEVVMKSWLDRYVCGYFERESAG